MGYDKNAPVTVRRATIDDAEAIATVQIRTWQAAYRGMMPQEHLDSMDIAARTENIRGLAKRYPQDLTLVSLGADGSITGFVNAGSYVGDDGPNRAEGHIRAIYVLPEHWGSGAGRALMTQALLGLAEKGLHPVRLWVLSANERARRFYALAGFAPDGTTGVYRVERGGDPPVDVDEVRYVFDGRAGGAAGVG